MKMFIAVLSAALFVLSLVLVFVVPMSFGSGALGFITLMVSFTGMFLSIEII